MNKAENDARRLMWEIESLIKRSGINAKVEGWGKDNEPCHVDHSKTTYGYDRWTFTVAVKGE
jgi:hypothetical protein